MTVMESFLSIYTVGLQFTPVHSSTCVSHMQLFIFIQLLMHTVRDIISSCTGVQNHEYFVETEFTELDAIKRALYATKGSCWIDTVSVRLIRSLTTTSWLA